MATDLGQGKSPPTAKYENFVKAQLARAEGRIRALDLTAALLGFAAATLVYGVVVALLDRLLELPPVVRQGACVVYLLAALAYLTAYVFAPLSRRINPYFAARQLEAQSAGVEEQRRQLARPARRELAARDPRRRRSARRQGPRSGRPRKGRQRPPGLPGGRPHGPGRPGVPDRPVHPRAGHVLRPP